MYGMGVVTTVFRAVIAAAVVVVLNAYWPHRPGPKYINPEKNLSQLKVWYQDISRYIKIYHIRTFIRSMELLTNSETILPSMSQK
jgi:hypothetical protein